MDGITALRNVLLRLRSEKQDGYPSLYKGKWSFVTTGLPQTTPEELDALFELAGIVPDEIEPLGSCKDCMYAKNGHSRGWDRPCSSCAHPRMTNFKPWDLTCLEPKTNR